MQVLVGWWVPGAGCLPLTEPAFPTLCCVNQGAAVNRCSCAGRRVAVRVVALLEVYHLSASHAGT
jgi:hypothetical protein